MKRLKTKEELDIDLKDLGLKVVYPIGYEAYDTQGAFAYVMFENLEARNVAEGFLEGRGFIISLKYWPGSNVAEIRIRKFTGMIGA